MPDALPITLNDRRRKALFLDRDGVINVEKNYTYRIEDFEFLPGIFELCTMARRLEFMLIVITNQAGIGRGYYTEADFQRLTDWMLGEFRKRDIELGRVYHCPYHPTEGIGAYRQESRDRKPNPGMILKAQQDFGLDLARSVLIGDKDSDMAAGRSGGIRHLLKLVHPSEINNGRTEEGVLQVDTLSSATNWFETTFR